MVHASAGTGLSPSHPPVSSLWHSLALTAFVTESILSAFDTPRPRKLNQRGGAGAEGRAETDTSSPFPAEGRLPLLCLEVLWLLAPPTTRRQAPNCLGQLLRLHSPGLWGTQMWQGCHAWGHLLCDNISIKVSIGPLYQKPAFSQNGPQDIPPPHLLRTIGS